MELQKKLPIHSTETKLKENRKCLIIIIALPNNIIDSTKTCHLHMLKTVFVKFDFCRITSKSYNVLTS